MAKSAEDLKELTLNEFNKAAKQFDGSNPSVYNMCRKDYPDILAELEKEDFMDVLDAGCGCKETEKCKVFMRRLRKASLFSQFL